MKRAKRKTPTDREAHIMTKPQSLKSSDPRVLAVAKLLRRGATTLVAGAKVLGVTVERLHELLREFLGDEIYATLMRVAGEAAKSPGKKAFSWKSDNELNDPCTN